MKIKVNETVRECEETATLHGVCEWYKPEADVLILNGFPVSEDHSLCSRDEAVLLKSRNVPAIFQDARIIAEAFDGPEAKAMLINTVLERVPEAFVVGVSGLAGYGPCDGLDIRRFSERCFVVGDGVSAAGPGVGLMSPRVGVAAHHQANVVLRLLLDEEGVRG